MATPSDTVWKNWSTGSDSNGGGFSKANKGATGVDRTESATAYKSFTTLAGSASTTLTCSGADTFDNTMLGNAINISGQGTYCIVGFTSSTSVTVDRALGTFSGASGNVGGAMATLAAICALAVTGNVCYIKTATYSVGAQIDTGANWQNYIIEGYTTTPGDGGQATLQASAGITILKARNYGECVVRNLIFDGNGIANTNGVLQSNFGSNSTVLFDNCIFKRCTLSGLHVDASISFVAQLFKCDFDTCGYGLGDNSVGTLVQAYGCRFRNCTNDGTRRAQGTFTNCIAYGNGANGFENGQNWTTEYNNCTAYGNAGDGFGSGVGNTRRTIYRNCISYGNTGKPFNQTSSDPALMYDCAHGGNTGGETTPNVTQVVGNVLLTANPFTNAASGDFSLNSTAGGGAACRAAGYPGAFPGGTTTGYLDIGALQHQDTGGGGGSGPVPMIGSAMIRGVA